MTNQKPSHPEDEYFAREDAEKKRKLALQVKKETEAAELQRLKALHYMQCPKCGLPLQEVKFKHIDVDVSDTLGEQCQSVSFIFSGCINQSAWVQ